MNPSNASDDDPHHDQDDKEDLMGPSPSKGEAILTVEEVMKAND